MNLKLRLLITNLLLIACSIKAQNLDKQSTIKYIKANLKEGITVDSLGNIAIANKLKFSYRNINLLEKTSTNKINFSCKNFENCIENTDKENNKKQYTYTLSIENKELYQRLYNAFEHLLFLLQEEKPDSKELDPFAPHNYKTKN